MRLHEIPMTHATDVIGYTFNADIYCDGICILRALGEITQAQYDSAGTLLDVTMAYEQAVSVEQALDVIAKRRDIDRYTERSFDSDAFPKVIFANEEFPDYCPTCAVCHASLDGFDPADYDDADDGLCHGGDDRRPCETAQGGGTCEHMTDDTTED